MQRAEFSTKRHMAVYAVEKYNSSINSIDLDIVYSYYF